VREKRYFPRIQIARAGDGTNSYEAAMGLRLKSILRADLMTDPIRSYETPDEDRKSDYAGRLTETRQSLLHALSAWPSHLCVELRVAAIPNIGSRPNGRLSINMLIRSRGAKREVAGQRVASAFLSLNPIIRAHFREAEFEPVFDRGELEHHLAPFSPSHGVRIERIQEKISLSTPLNRLSIGFGPQTLFEERDDRMIVHTYPWLPSLDDWGILLNTMMGQMDPLELIVRVRPQRPGDSCMERLRSTILTCERFMGSLSEGESILRRQARMIRDSSLRSLSAISRCAFELGVFLVGASAIDPALANLAGRSITRSGTDHDESNFFEGGFRVSETDPREARSFKIGSGLFPCSLSEAACAFRLPDPPKEDIPGLPVRRSRTNLAFLNQADAPARPGTSLFMNVHQGIRQTVKSSLEDRFRHMFIIGQTGTGKSAFMERMILQDIREGRGVAVLDPHGELVSSILGKIPEQREKDVIFFDMPDRKRPFGFNLLQWRTIQERDLIIDELYLTLDRIYDLKQTGGPMFEQNFRGMLKLLMGSERTGDFVPTILEFTRCYQERRFRMWLMGRTSDPQTLDFLEELENTGGEVSVDNISPYITSKFNRLVQDTTLRLIVGQEKTSFDFETVMNRRKILLVNLGKGRFGTNASALLANQMVSRFKHAAMKRGEMRTDDREPFFLYVDECHNLPSENFSELLSEARKYKMGLVLATQYAAQIQEEGRNSDLLSAALGNVGTVVIFRLGHDDALSMAKALYPSFTSHDIIGLPNWEGYVRMQLNGNTAPPFSFQTVLDRARYSETKAEKVRMMSRKRYGRSVRSIENAIAVRRFPWRQEEGEEEEI